MKLHYKGKYDLNPDSLPHNEHMPNAVPFKEAKDTKTLSIICNVAGFVIIAVLVVAAVIRSGADFSPVKFGLGYASSMLLLFPHEFLHAVCFKNDVYLYTNWKQGMLFVVGPETMSKSRFIFMALLPNIVFGFIPYIIGMIFPGLFFFSALGAFSIGMGAGDYYNVFNAAVQMPKGARTYIHKFNSFWYMPEESKKRED